MSTVHVVLPAGVDDPARPSGGNVYDRRVCHGLRARGWAVCEHVAPGTWPRPTGAAVAALARRLRGLPAGAVVLVDGLVASAASAALRPEADRLRLVILVHLPLAEAATVDRIAEVAAEEAAALSAATAVVVTSAWSRDRLVTHYDLSPEIVQVAYPGVDPAPPAPGTPAGGELVCVAAVTRSKGHDDMLAALATVADRPWRCTLVGALDRDPGFVADLRTSAVAYGITGRVRFSGPRVGARLSQAYASADALVLASRVETYGMVVTEALARGLPVIGTAAGGVPEALRGPGRGPEPGLLVPVGDRAALASALRRWLDEHDLRTHLRRAAARRRDTLSDWSVTTDQMAAVLTGAALSEAAA